MYAQCIIVCVSFVLFSITAGVPVSDANRFLCVQLGGFFVLSLYAQHVSTVVGGGEETRIAHTGPHTDVAQCRVPSNGFSAVRRYDLCGTTGI